MTLNRISLKATRQIIFYYPSSIRNRSLPQWVFILHALLNERDFRLFLPAKMKRICERWTTAQYFRSKEQQEMRYEGKKLLPPVMSLSTSRLIWFAKKNFKKLKKWRPVIFFNDRFNIRQNVFYSEVDESRHFSFVIFKYCQDKKGPIFLGQTKR